MFKSKKKMRRFSLIPIFIIFIIPIINQPKIIESNFLFLAGAILVSFGFLIMTMGGYEFYKRGIISALSKKETQEIKTNKPSHKLVTTGIYGVIRHPQYVGLFTFFIGYSLLFNALYSFCISPFILMWFAVIAYIEENYDLELIFGEEYRVYKMKVGMFFPRLNFLD